MDTNTLLQELGFTDYEARAYVSLVRAGTCNGYEAAKAAGMPRANIYAVLAKLVERGAARRLDTHDGIRYAAVEPAQLIKRIDAEHRRKLAAAETALAKLEQAESVTSVFNLKNDNELLGEARALIDSADSSLRIALQPPEASALAIPLRDARERGVAITTLCMQACETECGGCQGEIHRYSLPPFNSARWLILIADNQHTLVGEFTTATASAITTRQRLIVELAGAYINQSLALAIMADDLGKDFHGLLSHQAREVLGTLKPETGFVAGLAQITGDTPDERP